MTRRTGGERVSGAVVLAVALAAGALQALPVRTAAEDARLGGRREASLNIGPFFEYRRARARAADGLPPSVAALKTYWAVRPFYSQVRDEATGTVERDFLWPVATYHATAAGYWWNALVLMYGNAREDERSWEFDFYPIWFSGRERHGTGYWALFPIYGTHPHFLFADDITFALWPVYHDYAVKGVRSHAVLWPIFSWKDGPRASVGIWPIWGTAHRRESDHSYALWPVVTWASYDDDRDTSAEGWSYMVWPIWGQVERARESQYLFLPPFFSYAWTDGTRRARMPWPFVDVEISPVRERVSVFPFYEHVAGFSYAGRRPEETVHRVGWKLFEHSEIVTATSREKVISLFPFFTWERLWFKPNARAGAEAASGEERLRSEYLRIWPFYSSTREGGQVARRALELLPIRHSEGFDRNWAPFWTFWRADTRPGGRTRHSLFWKIIVWHTDSCPDEPKGNTAP